MNFKTINENILDLAMQEMTEDGIHHDDFPDRQDEYVGRILKDLLNNMIMKTNMISDTVKKWEKELEKVINENTFTVPVYPNAFTSEEEEDIGRNVKYQTSDY